MSFSESQVPPGELPGTLLTFRVQRDQQGDALLVATVRLQAATLHPEGTETGTEAAARAAQHLVHFALAADQLAEPDVTASLFTSLVRDADKQPVRLETSPDPDPLAALRAYVAGGHALSATLADMETALADAAEVGAVLTLATVSKAYGVDTESLAMVNGDVVLCELFTAASLQVPQAATADSAATTVAVDTPNTSLAQFAEDRGIATHELLAANADSTLADRIMRLPGRFAWPADAGGIPEPPMPSDEPLNLLAAKAVSTPDEPRTPASAAQSLDVPALALLAANAGMPGLLESGIALAAAPGIDEFETIAPRDTLVSLMQRFARRGVSTSIEQLVLANAEKPFIASSASVLLPPADATLTGRLRSSVPRMHPEPVFEIDAWLQLDRPAGDGPASTARSTLLAAHDEGTADQDALTQFATDLEAAMPELCVARAAAPDARSPFAVVLGDGGIKAVKVTGSQPRSFGLRPLLNRPVCGAVSVRGFDSASGRFSRPQSRSYEGVDLDAWAATFIDDVDAMLAPDRSARDRKINAAAVDSLIAGKALLAEAIAEGLAPVLDVPATKDSAASAKDALQRVSMRSLVEGLDAAAVLQFDSAVNSVWQDRNAPRLVIAWKASEGTVSIADSTISLSKDAAGHTSMVVHVADAASRPRIDLHLDHQVSGVEFDASAHLEFFNPIAAGARAEVAVETGTAVVPVALRGCPASANLSGHAAIAPDSPLGLADAMPWSYGFRLQWPVNAHDCMHVEITLNGSEPARPMAVAAPNPIRLFEALAQHERIAQPLRAALESGDAAIRSCALDTAAAVTGAIAQAWRAHWRDASAVSEPVAPTAVRQGSVAALKPLTLAMTFSVQVQDGTCKTLTAVRDASASSFGWPAITCLSTDGHPLVLTAQAAPGDRCVYSFPATPVVTADETLSLEVTHADLSVARYQSANTSVWLDRNAALLPASAPRTADAFIYRTPATSCIAPVVPKNCATATIDIGPWSLDLAAGPLPALFNTIFEGDATGRTVKFGVRFVMRIAEGDVPMETELPVLLLSLDSWHADSQAQLASRMNAWYAQVQPGGPSHWAMQVELYPAVGADPAAPVLRFERLESKWSGSTRS